jgi:acetolactate synthase I/II/III large subunit
VAIVGDANRDHAWKNMTQEARQVEILRPPARRLIRVESTKRIPEFVRRAFAVATSGRPGPVVLDVPEDVAHGEHEFGADDFWADPGTLMAQARRTRPDGRDSTAPRRCSPRRSGRCCWPAAASMSRGACGAAGARRGACHPRRAHHVGKGAIACTHPLSPASSGAIRASPTTSIAEADLLIVVGCKLGEIATKRFTLMPAGVPLIHIEIVPEEIGRTTPRRCRDGGDARARIEDLLAALRRRAAGGPRRLRAEVAPRMAAWRAGAADRLDSNETRSMSAA